ncbi:MULTISPECIES: HEPN domain-containing protein [Mycolicibacterium]|uniref:ApeA N-terminal domain 1-containing protein n=1 Tax=Mycolicibacterium TaxID=1866885 RepID=UPI0023BAFCF6|nr:MULTISPECIES: HEPN domain-containing protein [Mycolicibacterium]MDW5614230.1 hypothetical protein [Mycolicibacterium sp. D5.8-2]
MPVVNAKRYVGKWWLPETPAQAVGGVLEVDFQSSRLRLELTDELQVEAGRADEPIPLIHGAANGRHVTLIECTQANGGQITIAQVMTTTEVFRPRIALVGVHLDQPDDAIFDGFQTSLTGLTAWADRSGLDFEQWVGNGETSERWRMTVNWTDAVRTELDEPPETMELFWSISSNGPKTTRSETRYRTTERVVLRLGAESPLPWNGFLDRSRAVQDLVTIATQTPSRVMECKLLINTDRPIPKPYEVDLFYDGIGLSNDDDDDDRTLRPLFTLNDVDFATLIRDWLSLRDKIGMPLAVLLGLDYVSGGAYQNRLFNAGSAAEGFHTALFPDSNGLAPDKHSAVVRQVTRALFYFLKDDRNWALSRIKDNRPGLKDRLVELVTKADTEAVTKLLTDVDTWAKWLKNARNAIGHLNTGELEKKVPLEEARYRLEYVTRALLHLVILAELGISSEKQREVVRDNWQYSADRFGFAVKASQDSSSTA